MKQEVRFILINKKKIFCYLSEPNPTKKKIVIISHGFRGSSIGPARQFVDFSRILNKEGYSVLRFDQPNSGNSDGDYIDSSFSEWVNTLVHFAKMYLDKGYNIALLGQSMGATATVVATNHHSIKNKIPCILLWVPGTGTDFDSSLKEVDEEEGQKYKNRFWQEARDANFFKCLMLYKGGIHLVYGEHDRYVPKNKRLKTIRLVREKGQSIVVLKNQNHSPWQYVVIQRVYKKQLFFLNKFIS